MSSTTARATPPTKRTPQRTCVGCGSVISKRELVRIVRGADGTVRPDPTGRKPGRGAYLHADRPCWDVAIKKKRLEKSLKVSLSAQDMEALSSFASGLPSSEEPR